MSLFSVFDVSGSALTAQSVRLNTIASNMANAGVISGSEDTAYRARYPMFSSILNSSMDNQGSMGVRVDGIVESQGETPKEYIPNHPMADAEGFVYMSNVNSAEEMANMISASRSYQSNVEAMETTKQLIMRTLSLGN